MVIGVSTHGTNVGNHLPTHETLTSQKGESLKQNLFDNLKWIYVRITGDLKDFFLLGHNAANISKLNRKFTQNPKSVSWREGVGGSKCPSNVLPPKKAFFLWGRGEQSVEEGQMENSNIFSTTIWVPQRHGKRRNYGYIRLYLLLLYLLDYNTTGTPY